MNDFFIISQQAFTSAIILIIWFQTEAFYEYCKLFGFKKLFKIKDYSDFSEISDEGTYIEYLNIQYDSFLVRLISCPICLGIWLNILFCAFLSDFSFFFVQTWLSFLLYFITVLLMKKSS